MIKTTVVSVALSTFRYLRDVVVAVTQILLSALIDSKGWWKITKMLFVAGVVLYLAPDLTARSLFDLSAIALGIVVFSFMVERVFRVGRFAPGAASDVAKSPSRRSKAVLLHRDKPGLYTALKVAGKDTPNEIDTATSLSVAITLMHDTKEDPNLIKPLLDILTYQQSCPTAEAPDGRLTTFLDVVLFREKQRRATRRASP